MNFPSPRLGQRKSRVEPEKPVNDATVTQADIEASNGMIHVIDSVLMPAQ